MSFTATPTRSIRPVPSPIPDESVWTLTIDQYHAMIQRGILTDDDPVELLEGVMIQKIPKNPAHRIATRRLLKALEAILPLSWYADGQEPLTTADSEPEPDVAVIRGRTEDYPDRHPGPGDAALIAEVADTTLRRDRTRKKRLYARASVKVYWIVNLVDRQVEVYTDPTGPADSPDYRQRQDYQLQDKLPVIIDGQQVGVFSVSDVMP